MSELRTVIREVLAEELARLQSGAGTSVSPQVREEAVAIRSNAELQAFVRRLLSLFRDDAARAEVESGRHVFRLSTSAAEPIAAHQPRAPTPAAPPPAVRFEQGLITEREVARLPEGQRAIRVTKAVRFTPLAREELRRCGINIEREKS